MRSKTVILLVLALGCGLVASIGISQMLQRQDAGNPGDTAMVWVVKTDIKENEPLTVQNLKLEQWPKEKIPAGALSKPEEIEGKRARVNLFAGEAVLDKKLLTKEEMAWSYQVPPGFRLTTVQADSMNSFGGLLHPDDRVDVLVVVTKANGIAQTGTKTILQDIRVFAVNDVVRTPDDKATESIKAITVTLLVTPSQAEKLALANQIGHICLVMRSPTDVGTSSPDGVTINDIFTPEKTDRGSELMDKPPTDPKAKLTGLLNQQPQPSTPEPAAESLPQVETFDMQVIRGTEITVMDFKRKIDDPTRWDNGTSTIISGGSSPSVPEADPLTTAPAIQPNGPKTSGANPAATGAKATDPNAPVAPTTGHS